MNKLRKTIVFVLLCIILTLSTCACNTNYIQQEKDKLANYSLGLSYDHVNHVVSAVQTVEFRNDTTNTLDSLHFHIYANAYRQDASHLIVSQNYVQSCYAYGQSYGEIAFDSVKVNDVAIAYQIGGTDCDILIVPLSSTLYPDESVTVEMVYQVSLANVKHRLGWGENTVNLGNFFPILCAMDQTGAWIDTPYYIYGDPFVSEMANFDVTLAVPSNFVVASTGTVLSASTTDEITTYTIEADVVRDFAIVTSPDFKVLSQTENGIAVKYYYFDDAEPSKALAFATTSLKYFSDNIAPYPYDTYSVVQADFCFGGMEYPMLSVISSETSAPVETVVHETIHQWFYNLVGSDQIENPWQDEGLVKFLTQLYLDQCGETPLKESMRKYLKNYTTYVNVLTDYLGKLDTTMRASYKFDTEQGYVYMTYVKGALMFNSIYDACGKEKFFACLKRYFDDCKLSIATPDEMRASFSSSYGADIAGFFDSYINGQNQLVPLKD